MKCPFYKRSDDFITIQIPGSFFWQLFLSRITLPKPIPGYPFSYSRALETRYFSRTSCSVKEKYVSLDYLHPVYISPCSLTHERWGTLKLSFISQMRKWTQKTGLTFLSLTLVNNRVDATGYSFFLTAPPSPNIIHR